MAAKENSIQKSKSNSKNLGIILISLVLLLAIAGCLGNEAGNFAGSALDVPVNVQFTPENPIAGQETIIEVFLQDSQGKPITYLEIDHERVLHMLIVRKDFQNFAHIHAEDFGDVSGQVKEGKLTIKHVFPEPGNYDIVVEFKRPGKDYVISQDILVEGTGQKEKAMQPEFSRKKKFVDYEIAFSVTPEKPNAKEMAVLNYHIELNGEPVQDLEHYLAAKSHLSIWSSDFSEFIHTHAMDEMMGNSDGAAGNNSIDGMNIEGHSMDGMDMQGHSMDEMNMPEHSMPEMNHAENSATFGPDVMAHVKFPKPGLYKVFAQFNHKGKVFAADFWVVVK